MEDTCNMAASGGHLEILKWAVEQGCPWIEDEVILCANMAYEGGRHVHILEWVKDRVGTAH